MNDYIYMYIYITTYIHLLVYMNKNIHIYTYIQSLGPHNRSFFVSYNVIILVPFSFSIKIIKTHKNILFYICFPQKGTLTDARGGDGDKGTKSSKYLPKHFVRKWLTLLDIFQNM